MKRRSKDGELLSIVQLKPFKPYRSIYTSYMYFKKIDGKIFTSLDNVRYTISKISFFPNDKVFMQEDLY